MLTVSTQAQEIENSRLVNCSYQDVSLSDALRELSRQQSGYTLFFLYDELEDFRITTTVSQKTLPDAILQMIGFYPIRMTIDKSEPEDKKIFVECTQRTERHLTGTLVDEANLPIAYANIAILNPADSTLLNGGVSNESGYFAIPYEKETILARISYVGYKTLYRLCDQPEVGTIQMEPDNYTLSGVTVKGHVPQYQMGREGLVTNVESTPLSQLGTADDVLKHVPGVIHKGEGYEIFGKGTPLIYINGRQVRNPKELEQLKSTDIKSIELITNPGAKYDATVGAVVKIVTVRKAGDGLSIDTWGRWQQGRKSHETGSLDLNYRRNGLDVFASLWAKESRPIQISDITQEVQTDTLWQQTNHLRTDAVNRDYTVEGGFNYLINEDHVLGAKYELTLPSDKDETTSFTSDVTANGTFYDKWESMTSGQTKGTAGHKMNAYYMGKVGDLDIDWNVDYLHSGFDTNSNIKEICQVQDDRQLDATNKVRNNMFASKLTLTYPLFGGSLDFGAEYTNTDRQDDYVNPQNYVASSYSTLKEQSISPYAEYSMMIPKIGMLTAGLRYEHVNFDYYDSGKLVEGQSRSYGNLFPSLSLGTQIGNVQAQIAYSAKTARPTYRQLSNDVFYANRYCLQSGNPLLNNTTNHNISVQGMWKFLQFSLDYSDERDAIITWMEQVGKTNVTMLIFKNVHSLKSFTPYVAIAPAFGIWHPEFLLGMRKQWLTMETTAGNVKLNKPIVIAQADNTFAFSSTLTGELNFSYQSPGHIQNAYSDYHTTVLDVSLVKTFLNGRLSIKLAGEDLLDRNRETVHVYNHQVQVWQSNYSDARRFVATIRYKFNATRSKYKGTGAGNAEKSRL